MNYSFNGRNWIQMKWIYTFHFVIVDVLNQCCARDVLPQKELYLPDYVMYHNLSRINSDLRNLAMKHFNFIEVNWNYMSRNGISQPVVHITNFTHKSDSKVKILLSYGEHARELLPVESMFYLLRNITSSLYHDISETSGTYMHNILRNLDLYIIAIVNPDGRKYIEKHGNYCWRGTSTGVDLNRNFDWNFGSKGSSRNPQDEEYRGSYPFSEPECHVLTDLTKSVQFDAFISFHSGIKQIYVPYADTLSKETSRYPENFKGMLELAKKLSRSVKKKFTYGHAHQLNEYTADGTIFDYMAGKRKIPFSFAVELWGNLEDQRSQCFDLFNPKSELLQKTVRDLHPFYIEFFSHMIKWKKNHQKVSMTEAMVPVLEHRINLKYYYVAVAVIILVVLIIYFNKRLQTPCFRLYQKRRIVSLRSLSSTFSFSTFLKSS